MRPEQDRLRRVVLFDGTCPLCHAVVRFLIRRDAEGRFQFAALDSEAGRRILGAAPRGEVDSVVLLEGNRTYRRSEAALRIVSSLRGPWSALRVLRLVPRPIRDAVYDGVAARRSRWFGTLPTCPLPGPEVRDRFLA